MLKDKVQKQILALAHIGSLIKGIVHNMNSPLSAVLGRSEMLQLRLQKLKKFDSESSVTEILDKCINDVEMIISNCSKVNLQVSSAGLRNTREFIVIT